MKGSDFTEGRHEKGNAFLSSSMPGEPTAPPVTALGAVSADTGRYIEQAYQQKPVHPPKRVRADFDPEAETSQFTMPPRKYQR